jgi:DNA/RNA endonuclease YhcR with UshA esterase domain
VYFLFASVFSRFPANPENYYCGKKVRVSGKIKEYQRKAEIILNNPAQIEILK